MMRIIKQEPRRFHYFACLIIVLVGLIIYSNSIHSSFHFDDYPSIVKDPRIRDLHNIPMWIGLHRGLVTITFTLNYYFSGLSVEGYHWTNIFIHLLNGVLVYFLVIIILGQYLSDTDPRNTSKTPALALFAALLFIASPLQTHTVNYIIQRYGELASTFYLLSIIFFIKAVSQDKLTRRPYLWSIVFFLIGTYCKEIAYTAFIMMFFYYICFVSKGWHGWSRGLKLVLPYIFISAIRTQLMIGYAEMQPLGLQLAAEEKIPSTAEHPWQFLLTHALVAVKYIMLLLWPLPGRLNVDYDVRLVTTPWEPSTLISTIIVVGLLYVGLMLLTRARLLAFFILWFLVLPLPSSSFFPGGEREMMVCYRMYLPGLAFYLLLVVYIHNVLHYLGERKRLETRLIRTAEVIIFAVIVLFYGICAYEHNKVWKTEVTLWEDAVKKSPNKLRPYYNLGKAYELEEMQDKAKEAYVRAMEIYEKDPGRGRLEGGTYYRACISLAAIYSKEGEHARAIALFNKALKLIPWRADGHNNLGIAYYRAGYIEKAEREFKLAIKIDTSVRLKKLPPDVKFPTHLEGKIHYDPSAQLLTFEGVMSKEEHGELLKLSRDRSYQKAINALFYRPKIRPELSTAQENLGALYEVKGMPDEAIAALTKAIEYNPGNANARIRLGQLWWNYRNESKKALAHLEEALKLGLDDRTARRVSDAIDTIKKQSLPQSKPNVQNNR